MALPTVWCGSPRYDNVYSDDPDRDNTISVHIQRVVAMGMGVVFVERRTGNSGVWAANMIRAHGGSVYLIWYCGADARSGPTWATYEAVWNPAVYASTPCLHTSYTNYDEIGEVPPPYTAPCVKSTSECPNHRGAAYVAMLAQGTKWMTDISAEGAYIERDWIKDAATTAADHPTRPITPMVNACGDCGSLANYDTGLASLDADIVGAIRAASAGCPIIAYNDHVYWTESYLQAGPCRGYNTIAIHADIATAEANTLYIGAGWPIISPFLGGSYAGGYMPEAWWREYLTMLRDVKHARGPFIDPSPVLGYGGSATLNGMVPRHEKQWYDYAQIACEIFNASGLENPAESARERVGMTETEQLVVDHLQGPHDRDRHISQRPRARRRR